MSTTVSYKGQTLTTVSNDTKTLLTEGKYLEDDLTLVDVSGGGAVLTTKNISANGTYNASSDSADGYSQVNVAVPASAVDTGTKNITANGSNQDVVGYAAVDVAVPNSYSASDEGKVVSNGTLVAQTAHSDITPTTSDQTIDTTTNNSIKVKGDADLIATNIKKDVEIFGVIGSYEGGGGSGLQSGSFIGTNSRNIQVPVTSQCSKFYAWAETPKSDDDLSDSPYGWMKLIGVFVDNDTGFCYICMSNNTAWGGGPVALGRWGGNAAWNNVATFNATTIKLQTMGFGGGGVYLIDGETYNWVAW